MNMYSSQHVLSLSEDVTAGRRSWQPLLWWDTRGPCFTMLDSLQTIVKLIKNCQHEQTLTLTLWGCLALIKQWNITTHTYFTSSRMQIMETWQEINFLGFQCRFMRGLHETLPYHVFRWSLLRSKLTNCKVGVGNSCFWGFFAKYTQLTQQTPLCPKPHTP